MGSGAFCTSAVRSGTAARRFRVPLVARPADAEHAGKGRLKDGRGAQRCHRRGHRQRDRGAQDGVVHDGQIVERRVKGEPRADEAVQNVDLQGALPKCGEPAAPHGDEFEDRE